MLLVLNNSGFQAIEGEEVGNLVSSGILQIVSSVIEAT
jgi:hypothetical protein